MAVLYRTDAQAVALGQALTRAGLPFQKRSHDLLGRRAAVPEILREMGGAAGPGAGGLGAGGLGDPGEAGPGAGGTGVADRLRAAVQGLASRSADARAPGRRRTSGGGMPAVDVLAAGEVLAPLARRCGDDLDRFLTEIALGAEADALDPRADAVTLLTIHAAKGLEFGVVFVAGCERDLLPLWLPGKRPARGKQPGTAGEASGDGGTAPEAASDASGAAGTAPGAAAARATAVAGAGAAGTGASAPGAGAAGPMADGTDLAEERRLLFVAMTRARTHLYLTCAARRRRHSAVIETGPSPFLAAIDSRLLDRPAVPRPRRPEVSQPRLL